MGSFSLIGVFVGDDDCVEETLFEEAMLELSLVEGAVVWALDEAFVFFRLVTRAYECLLVEEDVFLYTYNVGVGLITFAFLNRLLSAIPLTSPSGAACGYSW